MPASTAASKSPIKTRPLPEPGDSLHHKLQETVTDEGIAWIMTSLFLLMWAAWEWCRSMLRVPYAPLLVTIVALGFTTATAVKVKRLRRRAKQIRLGIEGEKSVGQSLDRLRSRGYEVFHDIAEDGYNIDHVLIGPTGVYAIETKTRSKPRDPGAEITYDGQSVRIDGHVPDRDPLKQAAASAYRVGEILQQITGDEVPVRPVVVFPGWFIRLTCRRPDTWVVNETYLQAWLDHEHERLKAATIRLYASAMASHMRSRAVT